MQPRQVIKQFSTASTETAAYSNDDGKRRMRSPLFWYWTAALVMMSFHYVLQVGDVTTSSSRVYTNTPWYLGIIKAELWAGFLCWCALTMLRRGIRESARFRPVALASLAALIIPLFITLARTVLEGYFDANDARAWLNIWSQAVPCVFLACIVRPPEVREIIARFAESSFWICLLFWTLTVILYFGIGRLPGSSWPGRPRFGGILDDPNGYAALMALLVALAVSLKGRMWRVRAVGSVMMLLGTQSITGVGLLVMMTFISCVRFFWTRRTLSFPAVKWALLSIVAVCILALTPSGGRLIDAGRRVWEFKRSSAELHVGYFTNVPEQLQDPSAPQRWIYGASVPPHYQTNYRDLSENFYFTVLLGYGMPGVLLILSVLFTFFFSAYAARQEWAHGILSWALALTVCSVGVPYLSIYPINLLFWSLLAMITICRLPTVPSYVVQASRLQHQLGGAHGTA